MKSSLFDQKIKRILPLILSGAGFLAIFLLAASLPNMAFEPGRPIPTGGTRVYFPTGLIGDSTWLTSICLSAMMALVPVGLIAVIVSKEARQLFIRYMRGVMLILSIMILIRILGSMDEGLTQEGSARPENLPPIMEGPTADIGAEDEPNEIYAPPELPNWGSYLVGFVTVLILGIAGYFIWEKNHPEEEDLSHIALKALRDLAAGRQWEDAVIECYAQMNAVVSRRRSLDRNMALTASEFSHELVEAGLPPEPVRKLTRLFEHARYSNRKSQTSEEKDAFECLTAITRALEANR